MSRARAGRRGIVAAGVIAMLVGFGYLLFGGIGETLVYFFTPSELLAKGPAAVGKPVRLGGMVVPGSIRWDADRVDLRFAMQDEKAQVRVHSHGAPPQMFREGIGVVVEGREGADGVFESTNLLVKHSNEYHPPKPGQRPADMYKTLLKEQQP